MIVTTRRRQTTLWFARTVISGLLVSFFGVVVGQEVTSGRTRTGGARETPIYCGAKSNDRKFILVGEGNIATLWDLEKGEPVSRLECSKREVPYLRRIPGSRDPRSKVEDSAILTPTILAVALSPGNRHAIIATNLDTTLWNLETGEVLHTLNVTPGRAFRYDTRTRSLDVNPRSPPREAITAIDFSADGKTALIGGLRHHTQLFDAASGDLVADLKWMAYKAKFYRGNENVLVLSEGGGLYCLGGNAEEASRNKLEETRLDKLSATPALRQPFEFSDDGTRLLCGRKKEGLVIDADSGEVPHHFEDARLRHDPRGVDLSADGNLALICWSIGLSVYDLEEGTLLATFGDYPAEKFWGAFFSADGKSIFSWGSQNGQAALLEWNLADETLMRRLLPLVQSAEPASETRSEKPPAK